MYICSNNNCWYTNVGEAFIDIGLKRIITNISKDIDEIQFGCISPMTRFYLPRDFKNQSVQFENLMCPDLLIFSGMYASVPFFRFDDVYRQFETALEIKKKGGQIAFVGFGGARYSEEERDKVLIGLDKIQPAFIVTRDQSTFDMYTDYFECKKGLDCAFWLNEDFQPKGVKHIDYEISTFNRSDEPEEIAKKDGIIHPWHMQYYLNSSKTRYLSKENLFVSDSPYEYLTLYANALHVYTDLVHATIPSLLYNTPVKYWKIDKRRDAFESIEYLIKDDNGFMYLNHNKLELEKREIEDYIKKHILSMI